MKSVIFAEQHGLNNKKDQLGLCQVGPNHLLKVNLQIQFQPL